MPNARVQSPHALNPESAGFVTMFDNMVANAFQSPGKGLADFFARRNVVPGGDKITVYTSPIEYTMQPYAKQGDNPFVGTQYTRDPVEVTADVAVARVKIPRETVRRNNIDDAMEVMQLLQKTIGRAKDQMMIDALAALDSGYSAGTVPAVFKGPGVSSSSPVGLNYSKLVAASAIMSQNNVEPSECAAIVPAGSAYQGTQEDERFINQDYASRGESTNLDMYKIFKISDMKEGGLPNVSGSTTTSQGWFAHKESLMIAADAMEVEIEVVELKETFTGIGIQAYLRMGVGRYRKEDSYVDLPCAKAVITV